MMKRTIALVVFALLVFLAGNVSAQETRPASWDIVVSGSPDISFPLLTVEHSNGPTTKVTSPAGSSYEVTLLRDFGGNRSEFGVMLGSSDGYATMQGHWFKPAFTRGAFQFGPTAGLGIGMERNGFTLGSPELALHGEITAALKAPHGVIKIGAGADSHKVFAVRISAGVGF